MRILQLFLLGTIGLLAACAGPRATGSAAIVTAERGAKLPATQGAIGGIVRDAADGHPLSMVSIQAEKDGKRVAHDISDYQGNYRLGPLPPGYYDVRAKFAHARVHYQSIHVEAKEQTIVKLSIDLREHRDSTEVIASEGARGSIQGVVLDGPKGNPFPGTVVSLSADHLDDVVMAMADENGAFHFSSLRPGIYAIGSFYTLVEQGNVEIRRGNIVVRPGETTAVEVAFDLRVR